MAISYKLLAAAALDSLAGHDVTSLSAYFKVYEALLVRQTMRLVYRGDQQASADKGRHVLDTVKYLRFNPGCTRAEVCAQMAVSTLPSVPDCTLQADTINAAIQLLYMVDCDAFGMYSSQYVVDSRKPRDWESTQTLGAFVEQIFRRSAHGHSKLQELVGNQNILAAWYLRKRLHLEIVPTDSLADHLLLNISDRTHPTLHIFHHTTFLKAQLRLSEGTPSDLSIFEGLERGFLPRTLITETLMTLHNILFHAADDKSDLLLMEIATKHSTSFDSDCLRRDKHWRVLNPDNVQYCYWGERLAKLHDAAKDPLPRNHLMMWIQEHTSERNALYVAILGLFLSALFGLMGVIIGIVQTVISYRAWKYPVSAPEI